MRPRRTVPLESLRQLAESYGIQTSYRDFFGQVQTASMEALLPTLQALGASVYRLSDLSAALREQRLRAWESGMAPVAVAWEGRLRSVPLRLMAEQFQDVAQCCLRFESGESREWSCRLRALPTSEQAVVEGRRHVVKPIPVGFRIPMGYHRLEVACRAGTFTSLVIAAPRRAYDVPGRCWGVFLPLYALNSEQSWGAGDFSDLERLMEWLEAQGGHVVSTLPLMAAFLGQPAEISPYMPASRLFWNELYVDPRRVAEFEHCAAARSLVHSRFFERDVAALRGLPLVDHRRLMELKRPVLEAMAQWLVNSGTERAAAFRQFVASHAHLTDYARFRATAERQKASWPSWPQRLRKGELRPGDFDPAAEQYHQYAQWIAEEQMNQLAGRRDGGAGLYLDFPLGVHPHSYDVWRHREQFASHIATGAPPDTLFREGQNWGFPPPHPERMRQDGYAYWIACLRHQFRHTGWLRLDHVMGLHRLFWIPEGLDASQGVYVRYPAEELYAILSLESHRSRTILVGENLGTVPQEVTRTMRERGLKPMYVLQYEATPEARACLRPVPATAVASLNTHDMPPFAAFWKGSDIQEHAELGMLDAAEASRLMEDRRKVRLALQQFLCGQSKPNSSVAVQKMFLACQEWLAASRAKMVLINLEDLWQETAPQNVPGTHLERPNWQRKARCPFEQFSRDQSIRRFLQTITRLRSGSIRRKPPRTSMSSAPKA